MKKGARTGLGSAAAAIIVLLIALGAVSTVYVVSTQGTSDQIQTQDQQISALKSELQQLATEFSLHQGTNGVNLTIPVMNQPPTVRQIRETWYLSPSAHQDRFDPAFIIVNQGDTVGLTLIDNDTVAHDFVVGPPYNIIINATVRGLVDDLTGQKFTTDSRNNSPGVVVSGSPGNVTAKYSFVARYSGIYEFVCTYHAQVGMIGYLAVLPNEAYNTHTSQTSSGRPPASVAVDIVKGAGTNTTGRGFYPNTITVVLGVNSTVVWTNDDSSPHTVTSNSGAFDSGNMAPGQTYSFTFSSTGVFEYHCTYHPWMVGTVVVKAAP